MTVKTFTEQLEEVQTAITAVMSGQSYSISTGDGTSISVSKANLKDLREQEQWLRQQVARESRGGIRVTGGTPV